MSSHTRNRVQPGVPEGGQFAAIKRADADPSVTLDPATEAGPEPGSPYVLVSNGMVENRPTLPVLDLDLMDQSESDPGAYEAVDHLRASAEAVGRDDIRSRAQQWLDEHDELRPGGHAPAPTPRTERSGESEGDPYVVLEHGKVTNTPALPVLDLEFMVDWPSSDDLAEAYQTMELANRIGLYDLATEIDEWSAAYSDEDGYLASDD